MLFSFGTIRNRAPVKVGLIITEASRLTCFDFCGTFSKKKPLLNIH